MAVKSFIVQALGVAMKTFYGRNKFRTVKARMFLCVIAFTIFRARLGAYP
jgi:hypothetical protein